MSYQPSNETVDVLIQAGYESDVVVRSALEYSELHNDYPELIEATDKDFYAFLKAKYYKQYLEIKKNLDKGTAWRPGNQEVDILVGEGYWYEIIMDVLGDFIYCSKKSGLVISRFAFFRYYLRKRYPLIALNREQWTPDPYLKTLVAQQLFIFPESYHTFLSHFSNSALLRNVPGTLLPRYFFNFVKHNREKIIEKL